MHQMVYIIIIIITSCFIMIIDMTNSVFYWWFFSGFLRQHIVPLTLSLINEIDYAFSNHSPVLSSFSFLDPNHLQDEAKCLLNHGIVSSNNLTIAMRSSLKFLIAFNVPCVLSGFLFLKLIFINILRQVPCCLSTLPRNFFSIRQMCSHLSMGLRKWISMKAIEMWFPTDLGEQKVLDNEMLAFRSQFLWRSNAIITVQYTVCSQLTVTLHLSER